MSKYSKSRGKGHYGGTAQDQLSLLARDPQHKAASTGGGYKRCYETHPPLSLGQDIVVYGGSCGFPVVQDADIYVGHDHSFAKSDKAYPWEEGESFQFLIPDMGVPADKEQYAKMLDWLVVQLTAHKKVHIGCIGGHGRTGMTLSALAFLMLHEKDAITYVREHYCQKAVESQAQVNFLHDLFGIDKAAPAKQSYSSQTCGAKSNGHASAPTATSSLPYSSRSFEGFDLNQSSTIYPSDSSSSIWGRNIEIVKRG